MTASRAKPADGVPLEFDFACDLCVAAEAFLQHDFSVAVTS